MNKSLREDQSGLGHILIAVLVVVVVAAAGFAGWRVMENNKSSKNKAESSAESNCLDVYKDKRLCKFAAANADLASTPYTAVVTSSDAQNQNTEITIKSDGKASFSTSSQTGNRTYNTITIGNTVYIQNGGGWIESSTGSSANSGAGIAGSLKAAFSSPGTPKEQQIQYKSLGQEKCGQDSCYKYRVISPNHAGTTYAWINTDSNRLVRLNSKSAQGSSNFAISYGPVTITKPSPILPASSALDPAQQAEMQAEQSTPYPY